MAKRGKSQQSRHNTLVRRVAGGYKSQGWKVKADVSGYKKPRTMGGYRPDVIATKGDKMRITEVETCSSMSKDTAQRKAFSKFANQNRKRSFRTRVT